MSIDISKPIDEMPALLRIAEVAALLRKSTRTIALWEQRGLLQVLRPAGGLPLVRRAEVERLLAEGTR